MKEKKIISKNELSLLVINLLKGGKSKQEIFDELVQEYSMDDSLMKTIAELPEHLAKERYRILNVILVITVVILGIMQTTGAFLLMNTSNLKEKIFLFAVPLIGFFFAIQIYKMKGIMYRILAAVSVGGLIKVMQSLMDSGVGSYIEIGLDIIIICLSLYLGTKMFPNYGFNGLKKDEKGNYEL